MKRAIVLAALVIGLLAGSAPVGAYGNPVFPAYDKYPCDYGYPIKGNTTTYNGELIYHVPGGDYYNVTNPEQCFVTEDDAVYYGYRRSYR